MRLNNNSFQRNANISMIAQLVWDNPGISRIGIAREVGLYKSTVTNIASTLIEKGIAYETESTGSSRAGRRPIGLRINEKLGCFLGLEIQPGRYRAVAIDITGTILLSRSAPIHPGGPGFADGFLSIVGELEAAVADLPCPLLGIVVGIPGLVNPNDGVVIRSVPLDLVDYDFFRAIAGRFSVPVMIENDANCCAWGELMEFRGLKIRDFVCVLGEFHRKDALPGDKGGIDVGLGVVVNGKVHYGSSYAAGEFRSSSLDADRMGRFGFPDGDMEGIRARNEAYRRFMTELSRDLAVVISVLNPSHLFIGGDIARDRGLILETMGRALSCRSASPETRCAIEFSSLGENLVAYGAASMFVQRLLAIPELSELQGTYHLDWDEIFALVKRDPRASGWITH